MSHETRRRAGWGATALARAPALTLVILLAPIAAGLAGTLLPAFGWLPVVGAAGFSLEPWRILLADPGLGQSLALSLWTGFATTSLSLLLALALLATCHHTPWLRRIRQILAPLLAVPHAALAFGLAFLIAPSGWLARWFSPWATGWDRPPDLAGFGPQDPWGLSLILALLLKQTPYLLFMGLSGLSQLPVESWSATARSLGYGPITTFFKVILPSLYPLLRLPVFAALAFSLTVVDVALIIGPSTPPTLAVRALRWFNDPELSWRLPAAAAAVLLTLLVLASLAAWEGTVRLLGRLSRFWVIGGWRGGMGGIARRLALGGGGMVFACATLSMWGLLLWSVARHWSFPLAWPERWTLENWTGQTDNLSAMIGATSIIGVAATALALGLSVACLEHEARQRPTFAGRSLWLLYLPLLAPQVGFLFGIQVLLVWTGLDGGWPALVWAHLLFVLPYVFLSLADPWRAFDARYQQTALALGASRARVFWRVKLPMLRGPVAVAAAVGFSISVAQYLPTLFAGAGRHATITTEAVTLASGANRRIIGVYAAVQATLPLLGFAVALWIAKRRPG
ncbi:MAG TPA: ABC transporter permease subunit [Candidatus Competibacter sp.]|nr:ABC transporter permease subunit [Candidatus Competibacter sp.]HUM93181.1 ABC transporter permease subunit [Candidatus Competibacter sp.]